MTIETATYTRRPFAVEGVQITTENFEEIADWCRGNIVIPPSYNDKPSTRYIKVDVTHPLNDRQTRAYVGDWILYASKGFKVYDNKAFEKNFELAEVDKAEELLVTVDD